MTESDRKVLILVCDMTQEMQQDAINIGNKGLDTYILEKDIACYIKMEFDKKYGATWHCIVGRNFSAFVTHETKHFMYFYIGQNGILLFRSGA